MGNYLSNKNKTQENYNYSILEEKVDNLNREFNNNLMNYNERNEIKFELLKEELTNINENVINIQHFIGKFLLIIDNCSNATEGEEEIIIEQLKNLRNEMNYLKRK
jgi:hypothetical protein